MKKRYVEEPEVEVTGQLTDNVGFIDCMLDKGCVVRVTGNLYAAVCFGGYWGITGSSIKKVIKRLGDRITDVYCFDSASELLKWLAK